MRPVEGDAAGEGFAKRAEADGEVGDQLALGAAAHARGDAPGQELRIFADIGDQVEELVGPVGNDLALGVGGHQAEAATLRLARRAQRGEIGVRVVGTAGQRRGGDQQEALAARQGGVVGELLGRDEAVDRGVLDGGLQVLADGQEIDLGRRAGRPSPA